MGVPETDPLSQLSLPPGFRFYPTDEELLVQYLCRKVAGHGFSLEIIGEIDLYKFDPWILPSEYRFKNLYLSIQSGDDSLFLSFNFVVFIQVKLYLGRKSGISSVREIGSTRMGPDPIGLLGRVIGRPRELIRSSPPRAGKLVSRKLWCFTSGKLPRELRLIGSCMSTDS